MSQPFRFAPSLFRWPGGGGGGQKDVETLSLRRIASLRSLHAPLQDHSSAGLCVTHTVRASLNSSGPAVPGGGSGGHFGGGEERRRYHSVQ